MATKSHSLYYITKRLRLRLFRRAYGNYFIVQRIFRPQNGNWYQRFNIFRNFRAENDSR